MSLDRSLKGQNMLQRHRNVLTRAERVAHLKELGLWKDGSSVRGLPKVAHRKARVGKKGKAETSAESTGEAAPSSEKKE